MPARERAFPREPKSAIPNPSKWNQHCHKPPFKARPRWWNIEKRWFSATFAACRGGRGLRQTDQTDLHSTGQVTARPTSTTSVSPVRNQPKPPNSPSFDHFWQRTAPNEDYRINGFTRVRLKKPPIRAICQDSGESARCAVCVFRISTAAHRPPSHYFHRESAPCAGCAFRRTTTAQRPSFTVSTFHGTEISRSRQDSSKLAKLHGSAARASGR